MAKTATPKKHLAREAEILVLPEEGLTPATAPRSSHSCVGWPRSSGRPKISSWPPGKPWSGPS